MALSAIAFMALYVLTIRRFHKGWDNLPRIASNGTHLSVSVLVAARNEEENISELLTDLSAQREVALEVIVIDDHSTDATSDVVRSFSNVRLVEAIGEGKKAAIAQGVSLASHDVIMTTDADCRLSPHCVQRMTAAFSKSAVQMAVGPVAYQGEKNAFEHCQSLEFMSLIGSGAGAIGAGQAFMCNGANLAYRKAAFQALDDSMASGDDVFLLHQIKKKGGEVVFVKEKEAIVYTQAKSSLSSFLAQRKRWAAKSSSYKDKVAEGVSWTVFLTNASLLYLFIAASWKEAIMLLLVKSIIDYQFLKKITCFFDKEEQMKYFYPMQLLYPFYIVYVAIASQLGGFEWKGRKHKK
jgi:cellulose synthase/poly-beta-1,6-N-acetylglucosamine synthase-like glycosyltransferase